MGSGALTILKSLCARSICVGARRKVLGRPSDLSRCPACLLGDHLLAIRCRTAWRRGSLSVVKLELRVLSGYLHEGSLGSGQMIVNGGELPMRRSILTRTGSRAG